MGHPSDTVAPTFRCPQVDAKTVQNVISFLGLTRATDTILGDDTLKGVSGGEKRRVTLGEMLVVGARVLLLDEISTVPADDRTASETALPGDDQIRYHRPLMSAPL